MVKTITKKQILKTIEEENVKYISAVFSLVGGVGGIRTLDTG